MLQPFGIGSDFDMRMCVENYTKKFKFPITK